MISTGLTTQIYTANSGSVTVAPGRIRLKAIIVSPGLAPELGGTVNFISASPGGELVYQLFISTGYPGSYSSYSVQTQNIVIPGNGILFPSGMEFTQSNAYESMTLIYQS